MHDVSTEKQWQYWYPRVYGYFYKRVNTQFQVEELTSQTMNTAFTAKTVHNFQAYIWKVAHNYLVKFINLKNTEPMIVGWDESLDLKNSTQINFEIEEEIEDQISQNYKSKLNQLLECVKNQITNPDEQKLIQLSIYEERNSTEIGKILNLNPDNIRQKLSRTLKKLRRHCSELWSSLKTN